MSYLHTTSLGDSGGLVAFCHGLFGQGRNFTRAGKELADRHRVLLLDLPNHGRSAWTEDFDYVEIAGRVAELFSAEDPVSLVGHSMGGKIAMLVALHHAEVVERLCVVDVAPVAYRHSEEFSRYIEAMRAIDLDSLGSRKEAEEQLGDAAPSPMVRGFLLQSLRRDAEDHWSWTINLELFASRLERITGWPTDDVADVGAYDGPVIWIGGARSGYVTAEHTQEMTRLFPRVRRLTVKGAGHWVHSEQPEVFLQILERFLDG